jgi:hypothetical protein
MGESLLDCSRLLVIKLELTIVVYVFCTIMNRVKFV